MSTASKAWALVVNPAEDLQELLGGAIELLLPRVECVKEPSLVRARARIASKGIEHCRLIVCSPTAPTDGEQSPALDARDLHGIAFVRELREAHGDQPLVIFPAAFTDAERAAELAGLENVRCIGMKDLYRQLKREIDIFVLHKDDPRKYHMDVDILLNSDQACRWTMRAPEGGTPEETGVIDLGKGEIDDLETMSGNAQGGNEAYLRLLGRHVYSAIMTPGKSQDFQRKLDDGLKLVGGIEHARIRFSVDARTQPILLETLVLPNKATSQLEFCMKWAPIFRKLGTRGGRQPLFQDPGHRAEPIDCLLIQGCVTAFQVGAPYQRDFPPALGAKEEIDWLEAYLEVNREEFGIGRVKVLRYEQHPGNFARAIQDALTDCDYELVHYAGHSWVDAGGLARLSLGGDRGEQVDVTEFARWAREAQFVFLNSCQSASSQFIVKLVDRDVPAVLGYAWPVRDGAALAFARAFYQELLAKGCEQRLLEYSFMAAKRSLHTAWPDVSHWAAPLLFMQVLDGGGSSASH